MENLTKHEIFVALAMMGLLASDTEGTWDANKVAELAIDQANVLIDQLDKRF